ncbi:MAG: hypothetical protein ACYDHB_00985 [Candidatus Dormibacteria bacterium]
MSGWSVEDRRALRAASDALLAEARALAAGLDPGRQPRSAAAAFRLAATACELVGVLGPIEVGVAA